MASPPRWLPGLLVLIAAAACQPDPPPDGSAPARGAEPQTPTPEGSPSFDEPGEGSVWVERYQRHRQPELMRRLAELEDRLARSPQDARVLRDLAWLEYQLGRAPDALEHLQASARLDRRDAETAYRLGVVLLSERDLAAAEKSLQQAIERAPKHSLAWQQLGFALLRQESPEKAAEAFHRASRLNAFDAESRVQLARLRPESDVEGAILLLEEAVRIDRYHRGAHDQLRRLYRRLGRMEDARRTSQTVEDLALLDDLGVLENPLRPERFLAEADYYRRHERFDRAEEVLEEGIRIHPSNSDIRLLAGRLYAETGEWSQATDCFEKAVGLEPDAVEPFEELADWLTRASDPEAMPSGLVARLRQAVERWPALSSRLPDGWLDR